MKYNKREFPTVNLLPLFRIATEKTILEHVHTSHSQPFTPAIELSIILCFVLPLCTRASVEQYRNQEKINQSPSLFRRINAGWPASDHLVNTGPATNIEVLPAAMGGDCMIVGGIISLQS